MREPSSVKRQRQRSGTQRLHRRRRGLVPHLRRRRPPAGRDAGIVSRAASSRRRVPCSRTSQLPGIAARSSIVGWVAERFPALVREIRDGGHEIGLHGHWHRRVYDLSPEAFRAGPARQPRRPAGGRRGRDRVVPCARVVAEPAGAVGAADPRRGRAPPRRQPCAGGPRRLAVVSAPSVSHRHDRRRAAGTAAAGRPSRRAGRAARLGLGTAQGGAGGRRRGDRCQQPPG